MRRSPDIAIIGMGKWGNHLLENLSAIKALNVKYVCARYGKDVKVQTKAAVISDEDIILGDPGIQGVIISTQPEKHFRSVRKFLEKGLKVFVE